MLSKLGGKCTRHRTPHAPERRPNGLSHHLLQILAVGPDLTTRIFMPQLPYTYLCHDQHRLFLREKLSVERTHERWLHEPRTEREKMREKDNPEDPEAHTGATLRHLAIPTGTCRLSARANAEHDRPSVAPVSPHLSYLALAELAPRERHRGVPLPAGGALPRVCVKPVGLEFGHVADCRVKGGARFLRWRRVIFSAFRVSGSCDGRPSYCGQGWGAGGESGSRHNAKSGRTLSRCHAEKGVGL